MSLPPTLFLIDSVGWLLEVCPFATRTSTGRGETLPVFKDISTSQAPERQHNELFPLRRHGTCDVRKMIIYLFFTDAHCLGQLSGTHFLFVQDVHYLLTNSLHVNPIFYLSFVLTMCCICAKLFKGSGYY